MAKDAVKSETGERRVALGERRRVAEMSPEEMRREQPSLTCRALLPARYLFPIGP